MNTQDSNTNAYMPLLFAIVLIVGMLLGFTLYEKLKGKPTYNLVLGNDIGEISEVFNYINARYVDTVDNEQLTEKVIEETLKDLDPHSNYIAPDELADVNEQLQGNFEGIGIEFSLIKDTIVVVTPITGGPSEKLGIQAGDKIIKIEDTIVSGTGLTNAKVMEKLRGKGGTIVNVSIYRNGVDELLEFPIKRDKIPLVSVDVNYMLDDEIGYIKINRFSATTYDEFYKALISLKETGMKKLIVDLRQNPGGYLDAAVNILDELIDGKRMVVYTSGRNYKGREYHAKRSGMFEYGDLAVLIDEGSASASEIVSGAVQDWDRGTVIGRRSFGKGLVQEQYGLSNGGALRLTVARYYTPAGRCIQKPYDEGREAYHGEIEERFRNGALQTADSNIVKNDSLIFKTLIKKREVYGGGGISPDVFVAADTTGMETFLIKTRGLIPQFSYDYHSHHKAEFEKFTNLAAFKAKYEVSETLFEQFKDYIQKEMGFLDNKILERDKTELKTYIKAYIARQLWNNNGYYPIMHELDETLEVAYEHLKKQKKTSRR